MIVRIMGEGQVELADSHFAALNELDEKLQAAMESGDERAFKDTLSALLDRIHELGERLPDDLLEPSELILPSRDSSIEEVRKMLSGEAGLIPG